MEKKFLHSACKFTVVDYTMRKTRIISICLTGIAAACFAASCKLQEEKTREQEAWQKKVDSIGNAMLDSIYKLESLRCDSVKLEKMKALVDSMLVADSTQTR
ncbi:MAG: hypothetical protein V4722_17670 [Bacteroidota bacterium]